MKVVYICSPYRGSEEEIAENVKNARIWCNKALMHGCAPLAPHLYMPPLLADEIPSERETALAVCRELVSRCDCVWVCGPKVTEGMQIEIEHARLMGKPIGHIDSGAEQLHAQDRLNDVILNDFYKKGR